MPTRTSHCEVTAMPEQNVPIEALDAPAERPQKTIDVRSAGPPTPLKKTLETLESIDDDTILVQRNDRVPQFLFPKLDDRGYDYDTVETDAEVVTAIWRS